MSRNWGTGEPSKRRLRQSERIIRRAQRDYARGTRRARGGCAFIVIALLGATGVIDAFYQLIR